MVNKIFTLSNSLHFEKLLKHGVVGPVVPLVFGLRASGNALYLTCLIVGFLQNLRSKEMLKLADDFSVELIKFNAN
jgi:hypothetical protein